MNPLEQKRIEREFKLFTSQHFDSPHACRDLTQIQFYIRELSIKIDQLKKNFNYVPDCAYALLAEYNRLQNREISRNFRRMYC